MKYGIGMIRMIKEDYYLDVQEIHKCSNEQCIEDR